MPNVRARDEKRILYLLLIIYSCLAIIPLFHRQTIYKEITVILESSRYLENHRVTHISFFKGERASFEGEWIYIPQGHLRTNVLLFDRTDPPDPQLESGVTYVISYLDTEIWRIISIKECARKETEK